MRILLSLLVVSLFGCGEVEVIEKKDTSQNEIQENLELNSAGEGRCGTIYTGTYMNEGHWLGSCNGKFIAIMQMDGNFVVYNNTSQANFSARTNRDTPNFAVLQQDGNFVVYDNRWTPLWASNTAGMGVKKMVMQDDGNLVLQKADGQPVWSTLGGMVRNNQSSQPERKSSFSGKGCGSCPFGVETMYGWSSNWKFCKLNGHRGRSELWWRNTGEFTGYSSSNGFGSAFLSVKGALCETTHGVAKKWNLVR